MKSLKRTFNSKEGPHHAEAAVKDTERRTEAGNLRPDTGNANVQGRTRRIAEGFTTRFIQEGGISFVGERVSGPEQLASLMQTYRNPMYETSRIFYLKDDYVVCAESITNKLPGMVKMPFKSYQEEAEHIKRTMVSYDADKFYLLHNHPSGDPTPSLDDLLFTDHIAKHTDGFAGHVIINHIRYSMITDYMNHEIHQLEDFKGEDLFTTASLDHPLLNKKIRGSSTIATIGKQLELTEDTSCFFFLDGSLRIRKVMEVSNAIFSDAELDQWLHNELLRAGSEKAALVTQNENTYEMCGRLIEEGYLHDAVFCDPELPFYWSNREDGHHLKKDEYISAGLKAEDIPHFMMRQDIEQKRGIWKEVSVISAEPTNPEQKDKSTTTKSPSIRRTPKPKQKKIDHEFERQIETSKKSHGTLFRRYEKGDFMKLLELSQYADSLWEYAQNKSHYDFTLESEREDLQEARLEESITGEEGLYRHLQNRFEAIREKDEKLNCESVFNDFYAEATESDKRLLDTLFDKYTDIVLTDDKDFPTIMNANLAYQFTRFLRDCGSLEISRKEITAEDIDLLISGGKYYYKKLVESGYDYDNEGFIKQPVADTAKEFLTDKKQLELKQRLFVDMDGTLAVFTPVDELETLYQKGYFLNQAPQENVVAAVKEIIKNNPEVEVSILSAYLFDSEFALNEKNQWLDQYLPEIDQAHRIFLPCGKDKKEFIPGGVRENDFLLDDYTKNLTDWQPPARGIKLLNDINHTRGSWQYDRIRYDRNPEDLASAILDVMDGRAKVLDFSNQYQRIDPSKVLCFDIETTGLDSKQDEILQLSIIDGNGKTLFNEYVKPTKKEEWADAQNIHGISPEDVKDKDTFDKHLPKINRIFNNAELIVGYNHEWFDIPFLKNAGVSIPDDTKTFDVMHQFSPIYGQWDSEKNRFKWQKLTTCAAYYGYEASGAFHDSLEDVRATLHCYHAMTNTKQEATVQKPQPSIKRTASRRTAASPHMTEAMEK